MTEDRSAGGGDRGRTTGRKPVRVYLNDAVSSLFGRRRVREGTRAATEELFFDLVFVFAFVQLGALIVSDYTPQGVLRGMLVLALLWWSWGAFAWLSNNLQASFGVMRFGLFVVTGITFVMALSTLVVFTDRPGGLYGPLLFPACYFLVRSLHLALYAYAVSAQRLARHVLVPAVPMVASTALLLCAALVPHRLLTDQRQVYTTVTLLWLLAVLVDYVGSFTLPVWEIGIFSARHWCERYGLILIVAVGENIISIGTSSSDVSISWRLVLAVLLAMTVTGAVLWAYFDVVALIGEQVLERADPKTRFALARDAYSYLHLPMVAGILLPALGIRELVKNVGRIEGRHPGEPLSAIGLFGLYGGIALFLLANVAYQLRIAHTIRTIIWTRVTAVLVLAALVPVAWRMSATGALGLLAAVSFILIVVEIIVADGQRRRLRESGLANRMQA
ncbi:low temperature requirement protein A [Micromonospora olivasterospora]|uniref:Low temperature requirement protein LtrA n=1 Tax=Micromonospora olivasterospora TaxID=1880 RepID=A0A562I397_MICOL|nr:low temperature requirement protein A [Micromonospora olivasterospora]TWH65178.1 low temperature requirement protein LtrA [Micromonospora olivasterospora]